MGMLNRFTTIMKSNINAMMDKMENPAKMIDQTLLDARENLAEIKKETAGLMADARNASRAVDDCQKQIDEYKLAATNALKAGNETDARTLLAKKQQYEEQMITLQKTKAMADENEAKMRQMHDKLISDISALETRRDSIKATVAIAKAQQHVNKVVAGGDKAKGSMEAFDRMEKKANKMLDAAQAEAELNAGSSEDDLVDKYTTGANSSSVDDELAAMKAELGH